MPSRLRSISIRGFRSLADVEIREMPQVTVLLGANGAGKSNILRFFEMLRWMLKDRRLGLFVGVQGGADDQLYRGSNVTGSIEAELTVDPDGGAGVLDRYAFELIHANPDRLVFRHEETRRIWLETDEEAQWVTAGDGHPESELHYAAAADRTEPENECARAVVNLLGTSCVYHYHDTDRFKKKWDVEDRFRLLGSGENLAPILLQLERRHPRRLDRMCQLIRRVLPGFHRFQIEEEHGKALLRWMGDASEKTFAAHLTSDGSLRFFALVTLLNLPPEMLPDLILLDEPELGLHPKAISLVAGMIKSLSKEKQFIVATQSPLLVDAFGLDEITVLDLKDGRTAIQTVNEEEYRDWLEDYSTGELWLKNVIGGRP